MCMCTGKTYNVYIIHVYTRMYHIIQYNGLQAEGSGDEEKMEGVESESIMTHISVPSQQEVS